MSHVFQVGAGSGGIAVLDLVARDPKVTRVTLVEPDVYAPHNVYRHLFPPSAVGRLKADLAAEWLQAIRHDLAVTALVADITDPARQGEFARLAAGCDVGVCAADNEAAKFAFDALMRAAGKPWALGEVLSGGIGGWVHRFAPGGACYGCVASHLKREVVEQPSGPPPDYSNPAGAQPETTIPASKASIAVVAGMHALVTLGELEEPPPLPEGNGEMVLPSPLAGEGGESSSRVRGTPAGSEQLRGTAAVSAPSPGGEAPPPSPARGEGTALPLPAGRGPGGGSSPPDFTSLLFSLQAVPGVFGTAFRAHRLRIPRSPTCLTCGTPNPVPAGEQLDAALDDALARLGAQ